MCVCECVYSRREVASMYMWSSAPYVDLQVAIIASAGAQ